MFKYTRATSLRRLTGFCPGVLLTFLSFIPMHSKLAVPLLTTTNVISHLCHKQYAFGSTLFYLTIVDICIYTLETEHISPCMSIGRTQRIASTLPCIAVVSTTESPRPLRSRPRPVVSMQFPPDPLFSPQRPRFVSLPSRQSAPPLQD